jgi:hypothetical protein
MTYELRIAVTGAMLVVVEAPSLMTSMSEPFFTGV